MLLLATQILKVTQVIRWSFSSFQGQVDQGHGTWVEEGGVDPYASFDQFDPNWKTWADVSCCGSAIVVECLSLPPLPWFPQKPKEAFSSWLTSSSVSAWDRETLTRAAEMGPGLL